MNVQSYRDLIAWQRGVDLVEGIYRATQNWPREETYSLTDQVRRAAVSVPANIAEGHGRHSTKEFLQHLGIASGSLCEAETHLVIANRLQYVSPDDLEALLEQTAEVGRLLHGLKRSLRALLSSP